MMVERSLYIENVGQLMQDLDQATLHFEKINQKGLTASKQDVDDLFHLLNNINANLDASFWEAKKLVPEGISAKIEKILIESQRFQQIHPDKDRAAQRNVDQQIASLSSASIATLNTFDKNLKDLKKHKIGVRVEKIGESKHSQP